MLNLSDEAAFQAFSQDLNNPNSPNYHRTISLAEFAARFGPSQEAYNAVLTYLSQNGFTLVAGSENRRTITVRGTRTQTENAFHVSIQDYKLGDRTFHASEADPAVPASLAQVIAGVSGLSNMGQWRPSFAPAPTPLPATQPAISYNGVLTPAGTTNSGRALPPGLDGSGQTVALVEYADFLFTDVSLWLENMSLPSNLIRHIGKYAIDGGATMTGCSGAACGDTEVLLDIAGVWNIAQGADIVVFEAPSGTDFYDVLNQTINTVEKSFPTAHTIVHTWLLCEPEISTSELKNADSLLASAAAAGYTVFTSTGDSGSTCKDLSGDVHPDTISYPSDLPHAIAVGGTHPVLNSDDTIKNEQWWSGSGFGVSSFFGRPSYQPGSGMRSVPDVTIQAYPDITVCQASASPVCSGGGGTSLSGPLWGGIWAIASQAQRDSLGAYWSPSGGYLYGIPDAFIPYSKMLSPGNNFAHVGLGSPDITSVVAHAAFPILETSISPTAGGGRGGTKVTIDGKGFVGVTKVTFGGTAGKNLMVHSDSKLTVDTPPAEADVEAVIVHTLGGESLPIFFSYKPQVTGVSPSSGPLEGGTKVTVTGRALNDSYTFDFGGSPAKNVNCASESKCTMDTPSHAPGKVAIVVKAPVGNSPAANLYTYLAPAITSFNPTVGPTTGGEFMAVNGVSLKSGMKVSFGGADATGVSCFDTTTCNMYSPAHAAGNVHLTATVDGVTSPPSSQQFTFEVFPTITNISPSSIPVDKGSTPVTTTLTITGTGFSTSPGGTVFNLGSSILEGVTCSSTTKCTASFVTTPEEIIITSAAVTVTVNGNTSLDFVNLSYPVPPPPKPPCTGTACQ
jgi:hypothetical protein